MLSASDWLWMQDIAAQIRTDRSVDVELRRGETTLEAQEMRFEAVGRGSRLISDAAQEARTAVIVFGAMDADIMIGDRFTVDSILYRIVAIAPNRDVDTQAEAVAVE
jgi:hypothetical protein